MGGGALRQPFQTNTFVSPWGSPHGSTDVYSRAHACCSRPCRLDPASIASQLGPGRHVKPSELGGGLTRKEGCSRVND